jgi:hypothetical protein
LKRVGISHIEMVLCSIILQGIAEPNLSKKALRSMAHVVLQIEREKENQNKDKAAEAEKKLGHNSNLRHKVISRTKA